MPSEEEFSIQKIDSINRRSSLPATSVAKGVRRPSWRISCLRAVVWMMPYVKWGDPVRNPNVMHGIWRAEVWVALSFSRLYSGDSSICIADEIKNKKYKVQQTGRVSRISLRKNAVWRRIRAHNSTRAKRRYLKLAKWLCQIDANIARADRMSLEYSSEFCPKHQIDDATDIGANRFNTSVAHRGVVQRSLVFEYSS